MKKQFIRKVWIFALAALTVTACSEDEPVPTKPDEEPTPNEEPLEGNFIVVTSVADQAGTIYLTAKSLDNEKDTISPIGSGLVDNTSYSYYIPYGYSGMLGILYGRGDAHLGQRFTVGTSGKAEKIGNQFEIQSGFVTFGTVGDKAYTIMSGFRADDYAVGTMNRVALSEGDPEYATFKVNEFKGYEGKNAALIGLADGGDNSFYSGLHFHEHEDIDDVVVAKIDATSLKAEAVYTDSRLSISGGFYRSARYGQIGATDDGDVYVFSGNHFGTKKAGALVIKKGASSFDTEYFWDLEVASGGYRFQRLWHLKDDQFFLEFYNEKFEDGAESDNMAVKTTRFAILDMSDKKFSWVTGFPALNDILGISEPYVFEDHVYLGVQTVSGYPQYYNIDSNTATAKKGLVVKDASSISATTFVEKK